MLSIHNTLSKKKEEFTPISPGKVGMYVCGMTVYDHCHIGHARVLVVFDTVVRHLRASGYDVTYVRNITDVDDKIINRALANNETFEEHAQRYIDAMHEDEKALGNGSPDVEPRATETIEQIIALIRVLIEQGNAYHVPGSDVYFAINTCQDYGKLSGRKPDELRAGERIAVDESKQDPLDFVLWKSAKTDEPHWDSPWGPGRPGWHIECSAMAAECLGKHFDIHGGGSDLQFPHHENEIAQSECANHQTFSNYWMHNGLVRLDDEKMSKSLGNFFTIRDVLKHYHGEEIRFFILSSHYRSPLNYSEDQMTQARAGLLRLYTALRQVELRYADKLQTAQVAADAAPAQQWHAAYRAAMNDDFNTAGAIAVLFDLATALNKALDTEDEALALAATLKTLGGQLGLLKSDPEGWLKQGSGTAADTGTSDEQIDALIADRVRAREDKDWATSDRIRDELSALGVVLEDKDGVTTWRRQ